MPAPPAAPPKKKTGCFVLGCAVLAGLCLIGFVASLLTQGGRARSTTSTSTSTSGSATTSTSSSETAAEAPATGTQWSYSRSEDSMAKGSISEASVESTNTVNFRFPYAGDQHGTLTLRTHPRYGKNAILSIRKGQFQCPSYQGCKVLVRFDDAQPVPYSGVGPEDNSTETIFIRDYSGFAAKMLKAKTVRLSASVYQEGSPVFEFDVSHFDQARYKPK